MLFTLALLVVYLPWRTQECLDVRSQLQRPALTTCTLTRWFIRKTRKTKMQEVASPGNAANAQDPSSNMLTFGDTWLHTTPTRSLSTANSVIEALPGLTLCIVTRGQSTQSRRQGWMREAKGAAVVHLSPTTTRIRTLTEETLKHEAPQPRATLPRARTQRHCHERARTRSFIRRRLHNHRSHPRTTFSRFQQTWRMMSWPQASPLHLPAKPFPSNVSREMPSVSVSALIPPSHPMSMPLESSRQTTCIPG